MNRRHRAIGCAAVALVLAVACGNDDSGEATDGADAGGAVNSALEIKSLQGCAVDADCSEGRYCFQGVCAFDCTADDECEGDETCSERGRCLLPGDDEEGAFALTDYEPSVTVTSHSDTVVKMRAGEPEAVLRLSLSDELPDTGLAYTIERDDEESWDGKVHRAFGDGAEVEIPIPVGLADPALGEESRIVNATIATALGAYRVALVPAPAVAGTYAGRVAMAAFGGTGLPLQLQVVTRPDGVPLPDAEEAWLVLPSAVDGLFSPIEAFDGAPDAVAAPLVYDDVVERWVATTQYEYRLGAESALESASGQVARSLRFEIEPLDGDVLVGRLADRWEGLYDARSAQGVLDLVDVVFDGELELERVDDGIGFADLPEPLSLDPPAPTLLPPPPTELCTQPAFFPTTPVTLDGVDYACTAVTTRNEFEQASPEAQAGCALASASAALQGETTGSAIAAFLDDSVADPGGQSFAEFLEACAEGTGGACVPTAAILCARQLLAHAFHNQEQDNAAARQLVVSYQDVTNEAFLGRQLAAFKTDNDTRLTWLGTTDYPAIVTSAVEDLVSRLLDEWQAGVLDAHLGVLDGYFDPSGLAVLSRQTSGPALDARRRLLAQVVQAWRGAMDALVVASSRWHELYQAADMRAEKAAYVRTRMLDLYLMAGMLGNLSRDAGTGYQATAFGAGFSELMRSVGKLGLPFDELVFARDAEVVISTSLDPMSTNETLLGALRTAAEAEIMAATESVQSVLAEAEAEALNETQLQDRMGNEINELRDELVGLCGLPVGCTAEDFRAEPECRVRVAPGECGFSLERGTGDYLAFSVGEQSVSEAGRALLTMTDAALAVGIAAEEQRAHGAQLTLELETLEALALNVEQWNEARLEQLRDLDELLEAQSVWEARDLADLREALRDKAEVRSAQIERMSDNVDDWNRIRVDGLDSNFRQQAQAALLHGAAKAAEMGAEKVGEIAKAVAEAVPKNVSATGGDVLSTVRAAIFANSNAIIFGLKAAAFAAEKSAKSIELAVEKQKAYREAELMRLEETASLDDAISETQLAEIEDALELRKANNERAAGDLQSAYDVAKAQREAELAYSRDMTELLQRRTAYLQMLEDHAGFELRVARAGLGMDSRQADYLAIVQRAELLNARLTDLEAQRTDVNQLVGSPGVVFARANRLAQAENRLQRAKDELMDWLAALEYYAVRPFIDQRLQILLARNPYQLEEIAAEMARLQSDCGGAVNEDQAVLSMREELLGITLATSDAVAGETLSPEERFRSVLREGYVPIDKRVRYTTSSTVGDLLENEGRVLSATFDVSLDDFANLASTCNAKVSSIAVQLVGDLGDARPTVTILYDGTSQLRSCQPGIRDYVELVGRDRTAFDEVTLLRVPGRSISPLATINEWNEDEEAIGNVSLGGLPLASQYTVLIDTEIGENAQLDWDELDDILLDVRYEYSDVFAAGQCE